MQKNLSHNFGINTSEVQIPLFTQIQNLATPSAHTSTFPVQQEKVKSKKFSMKRTSQSQEPTNVPKPRYMSSEVEIIDKEKEKA